MSPHAMVVLQEGMTKNCVFTYLVDNNWWFHNHGPGMVHITATLTTAAGGNVYGPGELAPGDSVDVRAETVQVAMPAQQQVQDVAVVEWAPRAT